MLVRPAADPEAARRAEAEMEEALPADSVVMSHFDPNTASLDDLRRLGLTKHEAVSLLKYRAAGKVFRIPEDLTLCYGISDSLYRRLEPLGAHRPQIRHRTRKVPHGAHSPRTARTRAVPHRHRECPLPARHRGLGRSVRPRRSSAGGI